MADYTGSATGAQIDAAAQGNFTDDVTITGGRVVVTDSDAGDSQNGVVDITRSSVTGDFFPFTLSWSDGEGFNFILAESATPDYLGVEYHTTGGVRSSLLKFNLNNNVELDVDLVLLTKTPSSASDTGTAGTVAWDANYIYVCTATDTWKRAAISTW